MNWPQSSPPKTPYPNLVVAIGGSAGSIPALLELVSLLPRDFDAVLLFANHLPYNRKSLMPELIERASNLHVTVVKDGDPLECAAIALGNPGEVFSISDQKRYQSHVDLFQIKRTKNIDELFFSVARVVRENAVGVILSGALSDGAKGLRAIKEAGGITMIQSPSDALVESMPLSALKETEVDVMGTPAELAEALLEISQNRPHSKSQPVT